MPYQIRGGAVDIPAPKSVVPTALLNSTNAERVEAQTLIAEFERAIAEHDQWNGSDRHASLPLADEAVSIDWDVPEAPWRSDRAHEARWAGTDHAERERPAPAPSADPSSELLEAIALLKSQQSGSTREHDREPRQEQRPSKARPPAGVNRVRPVVTALSALAVGFGIGFWFDDAAVLARGTSAQHVLLRLDNNVENVARRMEERAAIATESAQLTPTRPKHASSR